MDLEHDQHGSKSPAGDHTTVSLDVMLPASGSRYIPKRFHARGGMGEIWLAVDNVLGREVALKQTRDKLSDQHARFVAEAQIAGQLEHPSIVPVHDIGKGPDGRPYYVMKFVRGKSLKDAIQEYHSEQTTGASEQHLRWRRLLDVFVSLCDAVAYAHSRGVIHRDLKPDNVMLGSYGETVVLDWGLAKLLHQQELPGSPEYAGLTSSARSDGTRDGSVIGSPPYMPPEMAEGHASEAGSLTDVYLLGATLYSILCGEAPRRGSSHKEMVELARSVPPVAPRQRKSNVPRSLEAVCLKAMAMRPIDRYASATELADEIRRYQAGEAVKAFPEGALARTARHLKRHWRTWSAALAACLVIALGVFGAVKFQEAAALAAREQTRTDLQEFRKLVETALCSLASTDETSEVVPYYDHHHGEQAANAALAISRSWGRTLDGLPLPAERAAAKAELYQLLLSMIQSRLATPGDESEMGGMLALVEQAEGLGGSSRALRRLEAELYSKLGSGDEAERAAKQATDASLPATPLDFFLLGEQFRRNSAEPSANRTALLEQAIAAYESALQLDADHFWCHFQLARCHLALGEKVEALAYSRACLALNPDNAWGQSTHGLVLSAMGKNAEAALHLDQVIRDHPGFLPARLHRGFAFRQLQPQKALDEFDFLLQAPKDGQLVEAAYYRSQLHLQMKNVPGAIADATLFIRRRPTSAPGYRLRATARFLNNDQPGGLADIDQLVTFTLGLHADRQSADWAWQKGRLLHSVASEIPNAVIRSQLCKTAKSELEKAIVELPRAEVFRELGLVDRRLGNTDAAIALFSRGLEAAPNDIGLLNARAAAYYHKGDLKRASTDFESVTRHDTSDNLDRIRVASAHAWLGIIQASQQDLAAAESEATSAMIAIFGSQGRVLSDHYVLQHNLACIYGELCKWEVQHRDRLERKALQLIAGAIQLAERVGAKQKELNNIRGETCFESLRSQPEYQRLLNL